MSLQIIKYYMIIAKNYKPWTNFKNNKKTNKFIYNKDYFGTNLRLLKFGHFMIRAIKIFKKVQKKEKISKLILT